MTSWSMTNAVRSWNWSGYEGKPVTVEVYTDAEEAALYVNGEFLEKRRPDRKRKPEFCLKPYIRREFWR